MMRNPMRLPIEVIDKILYYVYHDCSKTPDHCVNNVDRGYLGHSSIVCLLKLRCLGSRWDALVMRYIFLELDLRWAFLANNLLNYKNKSFLVDGMQRLRRLSIGHVFYSDGIEAYAEYQGRQVALHRHPWPDSIVEMPDIQRLLEGCKNSLTELKLKFIGAVGFSEGVVCATRDVSNLKVLIISSTLARRLDNGSESVRARRITHDSNSLIALLSVVPSLESLSIDFFSLQSLHIKPASMPNIQHLFFACDESNTDAIVNFCRLEGRNLKFLGYSSSAEVNEASSPIFALRDSLEVLSIDALPRHVPSPVVVYSFPRLRILRCAYFDVLVTDLKRLQTPFFERIEILITNYVNSNKNWKEVLKAMKEDPTCRPINLKHIIFVKANGQDGDDLDLIEAFRAQQLCCHFRDEMTYSEILESETWVKRQIT